MKWPWVSRLAYELVTDERDRLRAQVDGLLDQTARLARRSLNLPERPPALHEAKPIEVPGEVEEIIERFASEAVRDALRAQCIARMRSDRTETWGRIRAELLRQIGPEEVEVEEVGAR